MMVSALAPVGERRAAVGLLTSGLAGGGIGRAVSDATAVPVCEESALRSSLREPAPVQPMQNTETPTTKSSETVKRWERVISAVGLWPFAHATAMREVETSDPSPTPIPAESAR